MGLLTIYKFRLSEDCNSVQRYGIFTKITTFAWNLRRFTIRSYKIVLDIFYTSVYNIMLLCEMLVTVLTY